MEMGLIRIFQHEIDFIRRLGVLTRDMEMHQDYSPMAAFRTLDRYNEGFIKAKNLVDFYKMFGSYPTELELDAIIRRIDTDGDCCLSCAEFTDFFVSQVNEEAALLSGSRP